MTHVKQEAKIHVWFQFSQQKKKKKKHEPEKEK